MAAFDKKLGAILTRCGVIDESQRDELLAEIDRNGVSLTQVVIDRKLCDEDTLLTTVAEEMNLYPINLNKIEPSQDALDMLSEEQVVNRQVLPVARLGRTLTLATANPFDVLLLDDVKIITGCEIIPVLTTEVTLRNAIQRVFKQQIDVQGELKAATDALLDDSELPVGDMSQLQAEDEEDENSAPIVKLSNKIFVDAYVQQASDIHIEPGEGCVYIRYRIDGILKDQFTIPRSHHRALISRIKIMSDLNISERRLPQDGRIVFKRFNSKYDLDLRVSTAPMNFGEKVCARILDKTKSCLPLDRLGFSEYNINMYRDLIQVPYGMILHCGPTGSGKSMTLYAALNEINSPEVNICTAEDPIEYTLPRLNQMQMKKDIGLTFAAALRCYLRQDPDIILVGEIRDRETAEIAIEAALTGHVLFSTLHTNDAPSTISRFTEMEIEPFMISTCLVAICAQRLLRRVCKHCATEDDPREEELVYLSRARDAAPINKIMHIAGCSKCSDGYKGRTGIHELLKNTDELRALINRHATTEELKAAARNGGMRTLFEDAMEKVKAGITSLPEALVTVRPDEAHD